MPSFSHAGFSPHALSEMQRRNIDKSTVLNILTNPDAIRQIRSERIVLHKILIAEDIGKALLYRVFIDTDRSPPIIVTVYRTSKIAKYE